jgi:transposase
MVARHTRKSEQLSEDQLALFAAALRTREAKQQTPATNDGSQDDAPAPAAGQPVAKKRTGDRQPLPPHLERKRILHDLAEEEKHCPACDQDLRPIGKRPASGTNTCRRS